MKITFEPTTRQYECLSYLLDRESTEILYGGSAGGGKTFLGCSWIIMSALKYPGTRWLIARSRLNILKITTIKTFQDIVKLWGIENYLEYNLFNNSIKFKNGSEVLLMDLFLFPQDPDFNKLGSLELTGALIDEAAEITEKAYNILTTRFRYKLKEYELIPKLLIVSNPTRNWLYHNFYKPHKEGFLPEWRKFIKSLPHENPYLTAEYIENLKRLPPLDRKRLYEGEWEFSDVDLDLFYLDCLYNMFQIRSVSTQDRYITCDVASTGNDKTIITYWDGLLCSKIYSYSKIDTTQIIQKIRNLMNERKVFLSNVIIDSIGVGVGVADGLKGCKRFIANEKPFNNEPFINIKSQLFFKFASLVNEGEVGIVYDGPVDDVIDEIISHRRHNPDKDNKYQITPKENIKLSIGRSPDIADALMMRMYFEYKPKISFTFV